MKNPTLEIANQMAESYGTTFVPATIRGDMFIGGGKSIPPSSKLHRTEKSLGSDAEVIELCEDMTAQGFTIEGGAGNHVFLWV